MSMVLLVALAASRIVKLRTTMPQADVPVSDSCSSVLRVVVYYWILLRTTLLAKQMS